MSKILITGATGFIGKKLVYQLLEKGHDVYALVRIKGTEMKIADNPLFHVIYGDLRDPQNINPIPKDIDAVYFLVHSMGNLTQNLIDEETEIAQNFVVLMEDTQCQQIIFLSGIIEDEKKLSPHLQSRLAVEKVLNKSRIPSTILRSSIIIGGGSASFEIIRDLVEKLPVLIAPKWVSNICQPIAIDDVLVYLIETLLNPLCYKKTFDIGGPEPISFKNVLLRYAKYRELKRYIINVPVLTPKLSSYWLVLISSVSYSICSYLVESMKQDTRKLNTSIDQIIPHECLSYEKALDLIFNPAKNEIISSWMDDWNLRAISPNLEEMQKVPKEGCLNDIKTIEITIPTEEVKRRIWSIGGKSGWYSLNWAWHLRGLIDKVVGGTGFNRGRRDPDKIVVGDSIDFWRVILADEEKKHLILYAEMKLPGEAWLEFKIDDQKKVLIQTATFRPKGLWGRLYWYMCLPFHWIIFKNMALKLAQEPVKTK